MAESAAAPDPGGRKNLAAFVIGAILAAILAEIAVNLVSPSRPKREVEDAIRELQARDPDVLVISSSHGRTFHVLGEEVARRTSGKISTIAFAVEAGMLRPMEWVLRHRAVPLLDERDNAGRQKRTRLRLLIFGVTWWDTCRRAPAPQLDPNVVSRAWTWHDYLRDVAANGISDVNRNFVRYRVQRLARLSRLVQIQGSDTLQPFVETLITRVRATVRSEGLVPPHSPARVVPVSPELAKWRADIETGQSCLLSSSELEALRRMEAFAKERGLGFTVVLFPLMPQTVTPAGKLTLQRFAELMRQRGEELGYRVIDMTLLPVLSDADFMRDMDHLSASGNAKFVDWALKHELAFILDIPRRQARVAGMEAAP